ncbi:MAG: OmpA family protein [Alphaproteobacteria bacterium]|nr:OmpA family protein [Alphaproteobacteria bacterium]MDE2014456.1 OmpA family protein [Alphaproteobacteria bacterium]MDE2072150.1 OmpA family protein [Alphaproteobacteria bacterium]MDE2353154.1 OmpA family protein [Alphaproteobacteria bacterium]
MASTRFSRPILAGGVLAAALALLAPPAAAQMYPGADVTTYPAGAGGVLLTPGGVPRALPPLLQPGQPFPGQPLPPIHLHMPAAHHARSVRRARPPEERHEAAAPAATHPAALAAQPPVEHQAPPPRPKPGTTAQPAMEMGGALGGQEPLSAAPRPPATSQRTASAEPAPAQTPGQGLAKQAVILFAQDATVLSSADGTRLKDLAPSLSAALTGGASRIELIGYGGQPGEKDSDSRRLSLKRAIAVRQALIAAGLPSNRIDVRALGGVEDNGATDRVDIFVKG